MRKAEKEIRGKTEVNSITTFTGGKAKVKIAKEIMGRDSNILIKKVAFADVLDTNLKCIFDLKLFENDKTIKTDVIIYDTLEEGTRVLELEEDKIELSIYKQDDGSVNLCNKIFVNGDWMVTSNVIIYGDTIQELQRQKTAKKGKAHLIHKE